jgi:hypothetical protein
VPLLLSVAPVAMAAAQLSRLSPAYLPAISRLQAVQVAAVALAPALALAETAVTAVRSQAR